MTRTTGSLVRNGAVWAMGMLGTPSAAIAQHSPGGTLQVPGVNGSGVP